MGPRVELSDISYVLQRVSITASTTAHVDGRPVRIAPGGPAAMSESRVDALAGVIYHRLYSRLLIHSRLTSMAGVTGLPQIHSDQLRAAFDRARLAGVRAVSDSSDQVWHFFLLGDADRKADLTRVYFHLVPQGAVRFVAAMTRAFSDGPIGIRFKVLRHPAQYRRADAGVVYVSTREWEVAAPRLERVHALVRPWLRSPTPLFALPLGHGVALAEDPGAGESFGFHRSRLFSEGIWEEFDASPQWPPAVHSIAQRLESKGLLPHALHLRRDSDRTYAFPNAEAPA